MPKRFYLFLFLLFGFISGCAPVISLKLIEKVDPSLTFEQVFQSPDRYKGKFVLWGGEIIRILPQDKEIFIEILQTPLNWRGKPKRSSASQGRFLIIIKEFQDLYLFKKGRKITIVGQIEGALKGEKIKSIGESDYQYPILLSKEIYLWRFHPYSSSPPYFPDPYRYDPLQRQLRF